ncbi:MAG: hypothetical protein ACC707_16120 [Thiohalomonadales bacterium]
MTFLLVVEISTIAAQEVEPLLSLSLLQDTSSLLITNRKLAYKVARQWKLTANIRNISDEDYSTLANSSIRSGCIG